MSLAQSSARRPDRFSQTVQNSSVRQPARWYKKLCPCKKHASFFLNTNTTTTAAAATATATSLYKYTYTLGRSLYVPITSRCNSIPLPVTRGPGFVLPESVAESLLHVRHAEVPNYSVGFDYSIDWLYNEEEGAVS